MATDYARELLRRQFLGTRLTPCLCSVECAAVAAAIATGTPAPAGCERMNVLEMSRNPPEGVSVGLGDDENIFNWEIMLVGPPDTLYEGGFFKCVLDFPPNFPNMPPKMTFKSEMWHPNVYPNGVVCISILHPPGEDHLNQQETADERWRPILGVESILVSVISMLSDPNDDSPANIDAAVEWRNDKDAFKKHCRRIVRKSQEDI